MLRKTIFTFIITFVGCIDAASVYKCVDASGRIEFSQIPCSNSAEHIDINVVNSHIGTEGITKTKTFLNKIDKSNKLRDIDRKITKSKQLSSKYRHELEFEISRLKKKKQYAENNLAGATWEESISTEMNAIVSSVNTKIEYVNAEIKRLQDERKIIERQ